MSKNIYTVYLITNKVNQKLYVGITTKKPQIRWNEHKSVSRKDKPKYLIHKAISKYGVQNFEFNIICTCDNIKELKTLETFYIKKYNTYYLNESSNGYNMTEGGEFSPMHNEEIRKRVSDTQRSLGKEHWTKKASFKEKMTGKKNPSFKGYYITPEGIFERARSNPNPLLTRAIMISFCIKNNRKIINNAMYGKSEYLKSLGRGVIGKTPKDLGFNFIKV